MRYLNGRKKAQNWKIIGLSKELTTLILYKNWDFSDKFGFFVHCAWLGWKRGTLMFFISFFHSSREQKVRALCIRSFDVKIRGDFQNLTVDQGKEILTEIWGESNSSHFLASFCFFFRLSTRKKFYLKKRKIIFSLQTPVILLGLSRFGFHMLSFTAQIHLLPFFAR